MNNLPSRMEQLGKDLPSITRVASQVANRKLNRRELIEEVISDVHNSAVKQYSVEIPENPQAWAWTTANHKCIDIGMREARVRDRDIPLSGSGPQRDLPDLGVNPASAMIQQEDIALAERVKNALLAATSKLSEDDAALWEMRFVQRISYNEMASILQVTPRIVGTHMSHVLDNWEKLLREELRNDPICSELLEAQLQSKTPYSAWVNQLLETLTKYPVLL